MRYNDLRISGVPLHGYFYYLAPTDLWSKVGYENADQRCVRLMRWLARFASVILEQLKVAFISNDHWELRLYLHKIVCTNKIVLIEIFLTKLI